jgi:hypothetical protein
MASEKDGPSDKESHNATDHGKIADDPKSALSAAADTDPSGSRTGAAANEKKQWSEHIKNFIYTTKITDWLIAVSTIFLVIYTAQLGRIASRQTEILRNTDKAANESADAAKEANQLNVGINRPWVRANILPLSLDFEQHGNKYGAALTTLITVNNSGLFPANSVYILPTIPLDINQEPDGYNAIEVIKSRCTDRKAVNGRTLGEALFKDSPHHEKIIVPVENISFEAPLGWHYLVCITYDIPLTKGSGRTGYLFLVSRRDDNHPGARFAIIPRNGALAPPALDLVQLGSYAE